MRSVSSLTVIRVRVENAIARCCPTASAVVTSRAARSVAIQSISRSARGSQNAMRTAAMQTTTMSSSRVNPRAKPFDIRRL